MQNEIKAFWDIIRETQNKKTYAKYGVFIEKAAKMIGWHDVLYSLIYQPIERTNALNKILKV